MPHNLLILPVIVIVLLAILVAIVKAPKLAASKGTKADAYYLKKSLFTPAEQSFLSVLESTGMPEYRIMAKVRLADIFGVKQGPGWQSAFNRISAKHVDFLLVRQSDGSPVLGIELDDSSHDQGARKARDNFVDEVFNSTGLPLLHVKVRLHYDLLDLKRSISERLITKGNPATDAAKL